MNLASKLKKQLPGNIYKLLVKIGYIADTSSYSAYVVGGFVRDLILGVKNLDIDIVIEDNGLEFAEILSKKLKTALVKYPKFGTATLFFPDKFKLDVATARSEKYVSPGALPEVKFASIKDDLYRRDFTINAMAISINKETFGELIDFFGGLEGLKTKEIRVLHNLSFIDDPTRIFRAVRFEGRYGFKIDVASECLIKEAVTLKMFDKISGERFRNEIVLLFSEEKPLKFLWRMAELDQLRFIHPSIKLDKKIKGVFSRISNNYKLVKPLFYKEDIEPWLIYFMALTESISLDELGQLCRKFVLTRGQTQKILVYNRKRYQALKVLAKDKLSPSSIYEALNLISPEGVILILSQSNSIKVKQKVLLFLKKINKIDLKITGSDLQALNIPAGPLFKDILKEVLLAKIDGKIKNKSEEKDWAKKLAVALS